MTLPSVSSYAAAREPRALHDAAKKPVPEIEIQARLYNGEFGTRFVTNDATAVEILHFGEWNREAGPDFKAATLRFDGKPPLRGDLEVDWNARDWERHGHAINPAYEHVALHLYIEDAGCAAFARTPAHRAIPQARLNIELRPQSSSFTHHAPVDMAAAQSMIAAAALFRLHRKNTAISSASALHGPASALFHGVATCLGYKNNALQFLLAAQRTGLDRSCGPHGEALLFGMAGFLEPRSFDNADATTRTYLKPLWDHWWTVRDRFSRLVLPAASWKLSGIRPQNHPHRRLGALAAIASDFNTLRQAAASEDMKRLASFFSQVRHPYWSHHWNLLASPLERPVALVGKDRSTDILVNAIIPALPFDQAVAELKKMRGPFASGRVRRASDWLTGAYSRSVASSAFDQQGLLQLHADFGHMTAQEALERIQATLTADDQRGT